MGNQLLMMKLQNRINGFNEVIETSIYLKEEGRNLGIFCLCPSETLELAAKI